MIPATTHQIPSLKDICLNHIISSKSTLNSSDRVIDALETAWFNLLSDVPQGVLGLSHKMLEVEENCQRWNEQFPTQVKTSAFFLELTKRMSANFQAAGVLLEKGNQIPFSSVTYIKLQEDLKKKWEDEALLVLWNKCILPQLAAPEYATAAEIRAWLTSNPNQLAGITDLNLSKQELKAIPPEIACFTRLKKLNLKKNLISILPSGIFDKLVDLSDIDLSGNQISYVSSGIFDHCTELKSISFHHNQISNLPRNLFDKCTQLESLFLRKNPILILSSNLYSTDIMCKWISMDQSQASWLFLSLDADLLLCDFVDHSEYKGIYSRNGIITLHLQSMTFNAHICTSNYSRFVKALSLGIKNSKNIKETFSQLERRDQCLIFEMVYNESGTVSEDSQWGERHVFDNMRRLCCAVKKAISLKFARLPQEDKDRVYEVLYNLEKPETNDAQWGEHHAFDNILSLIDAMNIAEVEK